MHRILVALGVIASAVNCPTRLAAQQAWKTMIIIDKPVRAVMPTLAIDTQRVVREGDGTYAVFLRATSPSDSRMGPRTDHIERHRLDCHARQSTYLSGYLVLVRGAIDSAMVATDASTIDFSREGPEREAFAAICQWAEKALPR